MMTTDTDRCPGRAKTTLRFHPEEVLDQAILQGMIANNDYPAPYLQDVERLLQRYLKAL
jgi:hypothetical protein